METSKNTGAQDLANLQAYWHQPGANTPAARAIGQCINDACRFADEKFKWTMDDSERDFAFGRALEKAYAKVSNPACGFTGESSLTTYLTTLALNCYRDHYAGLIGGQGHTVSLDSPSNGDDGSTLGDQLATTGQLSSSEGSPIEQSAADLENEILDNSGLKILESIAAVDSLKGAVARALLREREAQSDGDDDPRYTKSSGRLNLNEITRQILERDPEALGGIKDHYGAVCRAWHSIQTEILAVIPPWRVRRAA